MDSRYSQGNKLVKNEDKDSKRTKFTDTSSADTSTDKHLQFSTHQNQTNKKNQEQKGSWHRGGRKRGCSYNSSTIGTNANDVMILTFFMMLITFILIPHYSQHIFV